MNVLPDESQVKSEIDSFNGRIRRFVKIIALRGIEIIMESLILAQNERWRRVLSMQVER